jgi:hypothetical protein
MLADRWVMLMTQVSSAVRTAVPRHADLDEIIVMKICNQLEITKI